MKIFKSAKLWKHENSSWLGKLGFFGAGVLTLNTESKREAIGKAGLQ